MSRHVSRRTALKRGAAVGTLIWVPPVVASFRMPALGQVGSPPPNPEPSPTSTTTTPPTETPTPTPTSTPVPSVGGTGTEVLGSDELAETGRSLMGPTIAGAALTALGGGMRGVAKRRGRGSASPAGEEPGD